MDFFKKFWVVGSWFDPWSIMHMLFGVGVGVYAKQSEVVFWKAGGVVFLTSLLWEALEIYVLHWQEPVTNRVIDVLISLAGFFLVWWLLKNKGLCVPVLYGSIFVWGLILISGAYIRYWSK